MSDPIQCLSAYCGKAPGYGCDETCRFWQGRQRRKIESWRRLCWALADRLAASPSGLAWEREALQKDSP